MIAEGTLQSFETRLFTPCTASHTSMIVCDVLSTFQLLDKQNYTLTQKIHVVAYEDNRVCSNLSYCFNGIVFTH